jgi:transcriptional regulator with XRE-family HTH domain
VGSVAATEIWAGVRAWIDRLGLQIKDAAQHVGMETDQLERILNFPDGATPARVLLQVLEGLGLGIVGVESLTPAMLLRHFDQVRESKGMSKKDLSIRADVHRTYLIGLFQEIKPEPKLETILKLARALEVDLVIEKRRELPTPVSPAEQPVPRSQPQEPSPPDVATAQPPAASSPSTKVATPPPADALPRPPVAAPAPPQPPKAPPSATNWSMGASWAPPVDPPPQEQPEQRDSSQRATSRPTTSAARPTATPPRPATSASTAPEHTTAPPFSSARDGRQGERDPLPPTASAPKPSAPTERRTAVRDVPIISRTSAETEPDRWVSETAFSRTPAQQALANLRATVAQQETALVRQQNEYEQQLAEWRAAQQTALARATASEAAFSSAVVLGGTATVAVAGASTALAFVAPEDRRTAQAVMSIAGGAAAIAGALAERNSSARGALIGLGGGLVLTALIDLLRQSASASRGAVSGVRCCQDAALNLVVDTVAPGSNAAQAGLLAGDVITSIDGVLVASIGAKKAAQRMHGEIGTAAQIVVARGYYELKFVVVRTAA